MRGEKVYADTEMPVGICQYEQSPRIIAGLCKRIRDFLQREQAGKQASKQASKRLLACVCVSFLIRGTT